jgi:hypothetical protein
MFIGTCDDGCNRLGMRIIDVDGSVDLVPDKTHSGLLDALPTLDPLTPSCCSQ